MTLARRHEHLGMYYGIGADNHPHSTVALENRHPPGWDQRAHQHGARNQRNRKMPEKAPFVFHPADENARLGITRQVTIL